MRFFYHRVTSIPIQVVEQNLDEVLSDFVAILGLVLNPASDHTTLGLIPKVRMPFVNPLLRPRRPAKRVVQLEPDVNPMLSKSRLNLTITPHAQGTELFCDGFLDLKGILATIRYEPETPEMKRQMFLKRYPAKARLYVARKAELYLLEGVFTVIFRKEIPRQLDRMFDDFETDYWSKNGPHRQVA